jgi:hypothetical protein
VVSVGVGAALADGELLGVGEADAVGLAGVAAPVGLGVTVGVGLGLPLGLGSTPPTVFWITNVSPTVPVLVKKVAAVSEQQ